MRTRRRTSAPEHNNAGTGQRSPFSQPPKAELTPAQKQLRFETVERVYLSGGTNGQICTAAAAELTKQHKLPTEPRELLGVLGEVRQKTKEDFESRKETRRTDQLARLQSDLLAMRTNPKTPRQAIAHTEKLIADIEGNLAPRRLEVAVHAVPDALAQSCAGMTADDVERIIAEEQELLKKLRAIPATGVEVVASPEP